MRPRQIVHLFLQDLVFPIMQDTQFPATVSNGEQLLNPVEIVSFLFARECRATWKIFRVANNAEIAVEFDWDRSRRLVK